MWLFYKTTAKGLRTQTGFSRWHATGLDTVGLPEGSELKLGLVDGMPSLLGIEPVSWLRSVQKDGEEM